MTEHCCKIHSDEAGSLSMSLFLLNTQRPSLVSFNPPNIEEYLLLCGYNGVVVVVVVVVESPPTDWHYWLPSLVLGTPNTSAFCLAYRS